MDPRYPVNYPKIRNRWYRPSAYYLVLAYGGRFIIHRNNSFSFSLLSILPFFLSSFLPLPSFAQRNVVLRGPDKGFGNQPSEFKQHSTHEAVKLAQAALIPQPSINESG